MPQEGWWGGVRPWRAPPEGLCHPWMVPFVPSCPQELRPRGLDVKQEELGDLVDKEMAATAAAIETAAARIEVRVAACHKAPMGAVPAAATGVRPGWSTGLSVASPLSTRRC